MEQPKFGGERGETQLEWRPAMADLVNNSNQINQAGVLTKAKVKTPATQNASSKPLLRLKMDQIDTSLAETRTS